LNTYNITFKNWPIDSQHLRIQCYSSNLVCLITTIITTTKCPHSCHSRHFHSIPTIIFSHYQCSARQGPSQASYSFRLWRRTYCWMFFPQFMYSLYLFGSKAVWYRVREGSLGFYLFQIWLYYYENCYISMILHTSHQCITQYLTYATDMSHNSYDLLYMTKYVFDSLYLKTIIFSSTLAHFSRKTQDMHLG